MKRCFLINYVVLFLLCVIGMMQVKAQNAFYVYRNDGEFNAFFFEDVDSMLCSVIDTEGLVHGEYVTQEIYTPDSVYRIPLVVIDSIGFTSPQPILNERVVRMEDNLYDYLIDVKDMSLTFSGTIPKSVCPQKGQILVCTDFTSSFFKDGFVGKVIKVDMTENGCLVVCDTVNNLTEIFDQLVSVERLVMTESGLKRIGGSLETTSIPFNISLNYDTDNSAGVDATLYGALNGTLNITVACNITTERQYVSLTLSHGWSLNAGLNIATTQAFFKNGTQIPLTPALRFPAVLPLLKFQLMGAPFIRGEAATELDVQIQSPEHRYITTIIYENGRFVGNNKAFLTSGEMALDVGSSLYLNGFVQGGYLLDFYFGTIQCLGFVKSAVDFYMGPKIDGKFNVDLMSLTSLDYYKTLKESKIDVSPLSIDMEAYGEANYLGKPVFRHKFLEGTMKSSLHREWYMMPEFSDITMKELENDNSVLLSCTPSRDILFPVTLGLGLYDKDNNLLFSDYNENKYKRENEKFVLDHTFSSLIRNKTYIARPMIKIFGGTIPASPLKDINLSIVLRTGEPSSITEHTSVVCGYADGLESAETICDLGICYDTTEDLSINNSKYVPSDCYSSGEFSLTLKDLKSNTTYYYCTCLLVDGEYYYGDILSFRTKGGCPDEHHPHMIDLGLPSGTKWSCCNVGASAPHKPGNYYSWGETSVKSSYTRKSYTNVSTVIADNNDIAYQTSGGDMVMPTQSQIEELQKSCTWNWDVWNGVYGAVVTGRNGGVIFLPAASYKDNELIPAPFGTYGSYWGKTYSGIVEHYIDGAPVNCGVELIFGLKDGNHSFEDTDFYYTYGNTGYGYCGRSIRPVSVDCPK